MVREKSRAEQVFTALDGAERTWRLRNRNYEVTRLDWDEAKNRVTIDARIRVGGEVVVDDRFHFVNPPLKDSGGTTNPKRALMEAFEDTARIVTSGWKRKRIERIGQSDTFRGDTTTIFASSDGELFDSDANVDTARTGPSPSVNTSSASINLGASFTGTIYVFQVPLFVFDTSSITGTITESVLSLAGNGPSEIATDSPSWLIKYFGGSGPPLVSDWVPLATTWAALDTFFAGGSLAGWNQTTGAYNDFTASSDHVNKSGDTRISVGVSLTPVGTPTGINATTISASESTGTTRDPKLVVTYTEDGEEHEGDATTEAVATVAASGQSGRAGSAVIEAETDTAATGQANREGAPALSAVASVAATGTAHRAADAALEVVAAPASTGESARSGAAAVTAIATVAANEDAGEGVGPNITRGRFRYSPQATGRFRHAPTARGRFRYGR